MENLSRQEINWIIQALESEATECNRVAKECSENSPAQNIVYMRRDNVLSVVKKLHNALDHYDKRIAIK